jgi:hypothetical protein
MEPHDVAAHVASQLYFLLAFVSRQARLRRTRFADVLALFHLALGRLQANVFWDDYYSEELLHFAGSEEDARPDVSRFDALNISYGGKALGITLNAVGALELPKDVPIVDIGSGNGFFPQLLAVAGAPTRAFCAALGPFRRTYLHEHKA